MATPEEGSDQPERAARDSAWAPLQTSSEISPRDALVVRLVGRLTQAASSHIRQLIFADVDRLPMDRCLKRLTDRKYLVRIGRRAPKPQGGNTPAVYQLGARGWWYLQKGGRYWGRRAVSPHTMNIADLFTELVVMDRDGRIRLLEIDLEHQLKRIRADMYIDAAIPAVGKRRRFYVEVQLSARPDIIHKKAEAYLQAYQMSTADTWPMVAFVVWDSYHQHQIRKLLPKHELFNVYLPDEFISVLTQ
jgi:hypothetical protein